MVREVYIAESRMSEIDSATGSMKFLLLNRFCAQLKDAYQNDLDNRIIVIGVGSSYCIIDAPPDPTLYFPREYLEGHQSVDPLHLAATMNCKWALEEMAKLGLSLPEK